MEENEGDWKRGISQSRTERAREGQGKRREMNKRRKIKIKGGVVGGKRGESEVLLKFWPFSPGAE